MPKQQTRIAPIYALCADLDRESLAEPLSTHLTLSGAQRAHKRYHNWATFGQKYVDARICAYITTNHAVDRIQGDLETLAESATQKQLARLVVWQLPTLTPHTPNSHPTPPQKRDKTQAAHYRKHRKALAAAIERATAARLEESELLAQIDTGPPTPLLGKV